MRSTFPRSSVLVLGANSVQSLVPSTLISQVESLLASHRTEDALDLADRQRKKLQANISIDEDEADELRYVYQRIGFQCFKETRFAEAVNCFFEGEVDPRLVISYYPDIRGSLFTSDDSMDVFAGVEEHMPREASVEDIVVTNLVRNYSPHLTPNTRSAPSTAELRKILVAEANEKLEVFLTRWRARWIVERGSNLAVGGSTTNTRPVDPSVEVVDTILGKLYAQLEKTQNLYSLLQDHHHIVVNEVAPVLERTGQYSALCILYKQKGEEEKLLEVWSKIIDGQWTDADIKDPLSDMMTLLTEKRDRTLTQQWGLWLTQRDPERGLKAYTQLLHLSSTCIADPLLQLLMPKDSGKRRDRPEEDLALLESIKRANPAAGVQYLEYLSRQLHTMLATACIEQLCAALAQESVSKLWRAKAASYASSRSDASFLSYFASTTPDSPHKRTRLKTILFLAGSSVYDPAVVRPFLLEHQNIFRLELAVIDGKLGNHRAALSTLVHGLHDATSAELYCTLGGDLVSTKIAQSLAENNPGIELCASTMFGVATKGVRPAATAIARQKSAIDEAKKTELLKILLEVYMADGETSTRRAAHLVNSQAMNLDVLDAKDRTWVLLREEGMVIEEPASDDEGDGEPASFEEKGGLAEKLALQLSRPPPHEDVHVEKVEKGSSEVMLV
ncbi:hypothetical protein DXG03_008320 [Asterophora parasitica]|uniref:Vacuolar sorting protein 39/Transforming growth factor beta receptor-associated domain-containing protein n=1 Tax=Asterophora parasitica TaxID=117018 RepID=A0A9P7G974_9AGAR|nr:hypothetical protein DXG03_008320 [Asterophora parasitica]